MQTTTSYPRLPTQRQIKEDEGHFGAILVNYRQIEEIPSTLSAGRLQMRHAKNGTPTNRPAMELSGAQFEIVSGPQFENATEALALKVERRRARWDPEELAMMANYEAKNPGATNINQKILEHVLPHCTVEGIKGAHREEFYKVPVHLVATLSSPLSVLDLRGPHSPNITFNNDCSFDIRTSQNASIDALVVKAKRVGLELGHSKCVTFNITGNRKWKRWLADPSIFHAGDSRLRALKPGEMLQIPQPRGHRWLGVLQFLMKVPALKRGALERLAKSSDARVVGIAEAMLLPPSPSAKELRDNAMNSNKAVLYVSEDGQGLLGCDCSLPTHEWVMMGHSL
ncbi:hypothetical protein E2C01_010024 [Portunus trituberculatus]|uniref:Uncharacterized protein n=1 Tax=Portunus trituberculatus TaxID=210409 RepID=A0A5B7D7A1_PORTR|nr:hypothetical protein [Portunus trituberculatus]